MLLVVFTITHIQFTSVLFSTAGSWLVFNAGLLPTASGACSSWGILQVRAGVRGFARSVAPSRLSPHWALLSDLLPLLLFFLPETIPDYWCLRNVQSNMLSHFYFYIWFFHVLGWNFHKLQMCEIYIEGGKKKPHCTYMGTMWPQSGSESISVNLLHGNCGWCRPMWFVVCFASAVQ